MQSKYWKYWKYLLIIHAINDSIDFLLKLTQIRNALQETRTSFKDKVIRIKSISVILKVFTNSIVDWEIKIRLLYNLTM